MLGSHVRVSSWSSRPHDGGPAANPGTAENGRAQWRTSSPRARRRRRSERAIEEGGGIGSTSRGTGSMRRATGCISSSRGNVTAKAKPWSSPPASRQLSGPIRPPPCGRRDWAGFGGCCRWRAATTSRSRRLAAHKWLTGCEISSHENGIIDPNMILVNSVNSL